MSRDMKTLRMFRTSVSGTMLTRTCRAALLSLFCFRKARRHSMRPECSRPRGSGGFTCSLIQGSRAAASARSRVVGSFVRRPQTKETDRWDLLGHAPRPKFTCSCVICSYSRSRLLPRNGSLPERSRYATTPQLHRSQAVPYLLFSTSGAMCVMVPEILLSTLPGGTRQERPKSETLSRHFSTGAGAASKQLAALMSRWQMWWLWRYCTALSIWRMTTAAWSSVKDPALRRRPSRSPPSHSSRIR
mmetsp:Transcript_102961/g.320847  ORF Transcript_102961/g.320847 Transcript_102961/m.320847 type:complete len:245 (+) Transcript_102961:569-1303(+)